MTANTKELSETAPETARGAEAAPSSANAVSSWLAKLRSASWLVHITGPAILLAIWWVAYAFQLVDKNLLPSPFATLYDTGVNILSGDVLADFWFTLVRVFYAFLIAVVAAICFVIGL